MSDLFVIHILPFGIPGRMDPVQSEEEGFDLLVAKAASRNVPNVDRDSLRSDMGFYVEALPDRSSGNVEGYWLIASEDQ